jgi:putative phosphoribosyl transferase
MVCAATPEPFYGVGQWYADFAPTSDDEVRELLASAAEEQERRAPSSAPSGGP